MVLASRITPPQFALQVDGVGWLVLTSTAVAGVLERAIRAGLVTMSTCVLWFV